MDFIRNATCCEVNSERCFRLRSVPAVSLRDVLGWVISANSHWTITVAKAILARDRAGIAHSNDYHVSIFHLVFFVRLFRGHVVNEGLVDCLVVLEELIRVRVKSIDV